LSTITSVAMKQPINPIVSDIWLYWKSEVSL
jgi:hypothetical protein